MGWARFDDAYSDHPKIALAGIHAELLDVRAILYACRFETDGQIPRAVLAIVGRGIPKTAAQAKKLVEVGRWRMTEEGWEIVDFLDYNPSKQSREADREAARERMARARGQNPNNGGSSPEQPPRVRLNKKRSSDNPVPSPSGVNSSPHKLHEGHVENPAPMDEKTSQIQRNVLNRIVDQRLAAANGVKNRSAYRKKILEELPKELDLPKLQRFIESHPEAPIDALAGAILGEPNSLHLHRAEVTA